MLLTSTKPVLLKMCYRILDCQGYTVHHLNHEVYDLEEGTFDFSFCIEKDGVVYDKDFVISEDNFIECQAYMR